VTLLEGTHADKGLFLGLFVVPTRVILAVSPINAALNYVLGEQYLFILPSIGSLHSLSVWGPEPVRIGFIGAPIATAISFNLISISSVIYGIFYVEKTTWHPISRRSFSDLGLLVRLGLAGVGQIASAWWSWELVGRAYTLQLTDISVLNCVLIVAASLYVIDQTGNQTC
jgi:MATE family multidrug resistance protein